MKTEKKIVKALYKIKIDPANPPSVKDIINKLDMDADDDIIEEEYEQMIHRMEKKPKAIVEGKSAVKSPSSAQNRARG